MYFLNVCVLLLFTNSALASEDPEFDSAPETISHSGTFSVGNLGVEGLLAEQECIRPAEAQAQKEREERMSRALERLRGEAYRAWGDLEPQLSSCARLSDSSQRRSCAVKLAEFYDWVAGFEVSDSAGVVQIKLTEACGSRRVELESSVVSVNHESPKRWKDLVSELARMECYLTDGAECTEYEIRNTEIGQKEMDRQIAENEVCSEGAELDGAFGDTGLNADIAGGIGGLIGAKGTPIGSGGLGSRGSGLGGGTAEGLGGLGTKGRGTGSSGFGKGGGNFGAKGEGGITAVGGDPIIMGALDRALIDEVVKRHMNQITYCYQKELKKNPKLGGKVKIKFVISKSGSVSKASVGSSSMKTKAVESCISSRFLRMKFPKPKGGGIVIVQYPFVFGT
jgi:hypothetical protein